MGRAVACINFVHVLWGVRKGLIPRFKLLSHFQAECHSFEKWLILKSEPLFESKQFSPKLTTFKKWLTLKIKPFSKEYTNINRNQYNFLKDIFKKAHVGK
jgi:hypothetical protein